MEIEDLLKLKKENYTSFLEYCEKENTSIYREKLSKRYVGLIVAGMGHKGRKASEEESRNRSLAQKGIKLGVKRNPESVRKSAESMKGKNIGKVRSEETKEKYRIAKVGTKQSEETKIKRAEKIASKPYVRYQGVEYTLTGISEKLGITKKKVSQIRIGRCIDKYRLEFIVDHGVLKTEDKRKIGHPQSQEAKLKISSSQKGKYIGSRNSQFGKVWITKDGSNRKVKKEDLVELLELGWKQGRVNWIK